MFESTPTLGSGGGDDDEMRMLMELLRANPELAELLASSGTLDERAGMAQEVGQPSDFVPTTPEAAGIASVGAGIGAIRRGIGRHERGQMLDKKDKTRSALLEAMRGMGQPPQMPGPHRVANPALMGAMGTLGEPAPMRVPLPLPAEALGAEGELVPPEGEDPKDPRLLEALRVMGLPGSGREDPKDPRRALLEALRVMGLPGRGR